MPEVMPDQPVKPDPEDMEALAALEHTQWQGWTEWMLDKIEEELGAKELVEKFKGLPSVQRWRRQCVLHYSELTERERESDRNEVRLKVQLYRPA